MVVANNVTRYDAQGRIYDNANNLYKSDSFASLSSFGIGVGISTANNADNAIAISTGIGLKPKN